MTVQFLTGDCRAMLKTIADESVHCVVTSPPYFGLRDYGTATWEGGRADCDHIQRTHGTEKSTLSEYHNGLTPEQVKAHIKRRFMTYKTTCRKCGAKRIDRQIGLETTPKRYIAELVDVFREVRRVLRSDGVLWLNLGDSYANDGKWGGHSGGKHAKALHASPIGRNKRYTGLKANDLIGIPWAVAFALRDDGWYLRRDIIWNKPRPMPESVEDRCTTAHEYVFQLTKSERYYYDAQAIAEKAAYADSGRPSVEKGGFLGAKTNSLKGREAFRAIRDTRNKRSVWTIKAQHYEGDHFAVMPPELATPCILAGCPKGGTVLDPFGGVGTTALVADKLERNAIIIELHPKNIADAQRRIANTTPPIPGLAA